MSLLVCRTPRSARQAKRLNQLAAHERDADDGSDSDAEPAPARSANVGFAFLADSDSDSDASDEEQERGEDESEEEDAGAAGTAAVESVQPPVVPAPDAKKSSAKKSKKKNQRKKKQGRGESAADLGDEDEEKAEAAQDVDELLDEILAAETDASLQVAGGAAGLAAHDQYESSLLSVDLKFINADKEMKRIFGVTYAEACRHHGVGTSRPELTCYARCRSRKRGQPVASVLIQGAHALVRAKPWPMR